MERIHQMKVVPDVLPDIHPSLDLRVNFPRVKSKTGPQPTVSKAVYGHVEPGVFLLPEQVCSAGHSRIHFADDISDCRAS
jgi:large subunit ribosomal protein L35